MTKEQYTKCCDILSVPIEASFDQIKQSHRDLLTMLHPDKHEGNERCRLLAEENTKKINNAYDYLKKYFKSGDELDEQKPHNPQSHLDELTNEQYLLIGEKPFCFALEQVCRYDEEYHSKNSPDPYLKSQTYTIHEIKTTNLSSVPIKILGSVYSISEPIPVFRGNDNSLQEIASIEISIRDYTNNSLLCLPLDYRTFCKNFGDFMHHKGLLKFSGTVIPVEGEGYFFYLKGFESNLTAQDIIGIRAARAKEVRTKFIMANKQRGGVRAYIKSQIVKNLSIKGLDKAIFLDKAIDFMILQSFSFGMAESGNYSNKLHSLVIGSPAVGKKLLTRTASILNPIAFELPSTPAKLSMAGLVGNVVQKDKMILSTPGYLPLASGGIICIQDFHELIGGKGTSSSLMSTLSKVMEDGEVIDSTSARTVHKAVTAIHVDMNRQSQVRPDKQFDNHSDINIRTNILSRFDFIIEIPRNREIQEMVAYDMINDSVSLGNIIQDRQKSNDWARDLKAIVAYLTTNFRIASISDDVTKYILKKLESLVEVYTPKMIGDYHLSDMLTRLANSIKKYAKAIACSNCSLTVRREDVDEAFSFIDYKMQFLVNSTPKEEHSKLGKVEKRYQKLVEKYSNRHLSITEIANEYNNQETENVNRKTIERTVNQLIKDGMAEKVKNNKYVIYGEANK